MNTPRFKKSKSCCSIVELYFDVCEKKIDFLNEELLLTKEKVHNLILQNIKLEFKLNKIINQTII